MRFPIIEQRSPNSCPPLLECATVWPFCEGTMHVWEERKPLEITGRRNRSATR